MLLCCWGFLPSVSFYLFSTGKKKKGRGSKVSPSPQTCNLRQKPSISLTLLFPLCQLKYWFSQDGLMIFLLTQTMGGNWALQSVTVWTQTVPILIFLMAGLSFWFLFRGLRLIPHSPVTDTYLMCAQQVTARSHTRSGSLWKREEGQREERKTPFFTSLHPVLALFSIAQPTVISLIKPVYRNCHYLSFTFYVAQLRHDMEFS